MPSVSGEKALKPKTTSFYSLSWVWGLDMSAHFLCRAWVIIADIMLLWRKKKSLNIAHCNFFTIFAVAKRENVGPIAQLVRAADS